MDRAYDALRGAVATLAGVMTLVAGLLVGVSLLVGMADSRGAPLPEFLGDAGWQGYLLAWLGVMVCTPFAAIAGALCRGKWGKLAWIAGLVWLLGVVAQISAPMLLARGTGIASGGLAADLPAAGVLGGVILGLSVAVMVVLPVAIGAFAVTAGLGLLGEQAHPA